MREDVFNLLHHRCRVLYSGVAGGVPVLFLHGYSFTSDVWRDIGVLDALEREGIPFAAVDMPYGRRSRCSPRSRDPVVNVEVAREALRAVYPGAPSPFVVGASLGGYIALHYAGRYGAAGLLLIAPAGPRDELLGIAERLRVPATIIVGEKDDVVSHKDMRILAEALGARLHIYPGARHAAYLDKPDLFTRHLIEAYRSAVAGE